MLGTLGRGYWDQKLVREDASFASIQRERKHSSHTDEIANRSKVPC